MSNSPIDTLRQDEANLQELLANPGDCASSPSTKRKHTRWSMQNQKAVVTIVDESGATKNLVVAPRNLSTGGVSFLHGGFLHIGSRCAVTMRTLKGQATPVKGTVMRCSHRKGRVHEIGVKFDEQIDPRRFFIDSGESPLFNAESVNIEDYTGTALIVSSSESERLLIGGHLSAPGITTEAAVDKDEALLLLERSDPDIAFVDMSLTDPAWHSVVTEFRDTGYSGALIILSSRVDAETRMSALCAGVTEIVSKPYEPEMLHRAVAEYLGGMCGALRGMRPLVCDLDPSKVDRAVVVSYVDELQDHAASAHQAMRASDRETLRKIFTDIESRAPQFGLAPIGELCTDLLSKIDDKDWTRSAKAMVHQFIKMCRRAEAPVESDPFSDEEGDASEKAA